MRGCEKPTSLQGPVVATPSFTWSMKVLPIEPAPWSVASLNFLRAPSPSLRLRRRCPSARASDQSAPPSEVVVPVGTTVISGIVDADGADVADEAMTGGLICGRKSLAQVA